MIISIAVLSLIIMDPCIVDDSVKNANKMQLCNRIYYSKVYWRLNMFRAAHRSSSGALNCVCSLWFIYPCGDRPLPRLSAKWMDPFPTQPWQRPIITWAYKPEAANSLELLMMSGVPLETCWAFNKLWNNKFYYKAASCWYFYWMLYWTFDSLTCTEPEV
jgi:hypothetical protein